MVVPTGSLLLMCFGRSDVLRACGWARVVTSRGRAPLGALGLALGILLGALLVARVDFIAFSLPVAQLIVFAVAAIVVGIVAAIFPARRAAKLDPLEALQYE